MTAASIATSSGGGVMGLISRHPLSVFFLLTFGLTWAVWVPRAAGVPVGVVGQLSTWAPAVAAVLAAALTSGRAGVRRLLSALGRWRVAWRWYVLVILGPAAFSAAVAGAYALVGGSFAAAFPAASTAFPSLVLFLVLLTVTDGLGEEPAWRGFALPRLLERHQALTASLLLGVVWGLWHLPLVFTEGSALFGQPIWLMLTDIVAKSVLFTWVFLRTRGSVLLAALLHGSTNLFAVSPTVAMTGSLVLPGLALVAKWLLVIAAVLIGGRALMRRTRPERSGQTAGRER